MSGLWGCCALPRLRQGLADEVLTCMFAEEPGNMRPEPWGPGNVRWTDRQPTESHVRDRHRGALLAGMLVVTGVVLPAPDAAAIGIGTIQSRMSDHRGVNNGTTGNCITYSPVGTATSSASVTKPAQALTAHGRPKSQTSSCPATLNTSTQSAVGFTPSTVTDAADGVPFLIGRMIHYNNPVYADDRYFTGRLAAQLGGFTAPNSVTFDWQLDETPNTGSGNCCDDVITFTKQISDITLTQDGLTYRLVILGFTQVGNNDACPRPPARTP